MTDLSANQAFEELCQQCSVWLISYQSTAFPRSVYMIWYTDQTSDNTDRLLTYPTGKIVADLSPDHLMQAVREQTTLEFAPQAIQVWAGLASSMAIRSDVHYNLKATEQALDQELLSETTIEQIVNWLNLLSNYRHQDARNEWLKGYEEAPLLRAVWHYFYDYMLWPRLNGRAKGQQVKFALRIDERALWESLQKAIDVFNQQIQLLR